MKRIIFLFLSVLGIIVLLQAQRPAHVPAYPGVIERVQPDGDTLHIFLRGDEHSHFAMTVDGWQVVENDKGKICYCKAHYERVKGKDEKKLVAKRSWRQAHDADKRTKWEKRWLERHGVQVR